MSSPLRLLTGLLLTSALGLLQAASGTASAGHEDFGRTSDGQAVRRITLKNRKGLSARILTYGAIIQELNVPDRDGNWTNVVLSTDTMAKYERFPGSAAVIGRVANRIAGAQFELDGATYNLARNNGRHSIHGGNKGFASVVWNLDETGVRRGDAFVRLSYLSVDGEEGYPGNLRTTVTYTLTDDDELRVDYTADTDKPTIVNLTNHAYFNLAGGGSCLDNLLWIPATHYTPSDNELIPTGKIAPVGGTPVDFRKPTRVGERFGQLRKGLNGYDHNFVLSGGRRLKKAARLTEPRSGRVMEVRTTQPAIQLYTGNHLGNTAVCLETQAYPDAIHHPNFPSIVVRPNKPLKETTVFAFKTVRK